MNALLQLEVGVWAEGREWTRQRLESQAQKQVNDWGALCPQSGQGLQRRKRQRLKLMTCVGTIVLKSWRGYSEALQRWVNPVRERWGLKPKQRLSPELQSRLGFTATVAGSYQKAAATASRWGTPISDNTVHAVVQQLGEGAGGLRLPQFPKAAGEPEFSLVIMMDGWLWPVAEDRFSQAILVLDFHHASEHLWAVAHLLHGEGADEARSWVEPLLHQLRHGQEEKVVHTLEALLQVKHGGNAPLRRALQTPVDYFQTHREHIHYQSVARQGGPIGSGSVESFCSQLQDRFKRTGQFWSPPGLKHLLAVEVLLRNGDYDLLWN
jgi:hypothetical protein